MKRYCPRRLEMRCTPTVVFVLAALVLAVVSFAAGFLLREPAKAETIEPPVQEVETEPLYSEEELEMLACVIYQEAGGDACCDNCRMRVGDVVLNRVADERFPDTMYEVLTQEKQYGRYHWTGIVWPERAALPEEAHAVVRAYVIAEKLLTGQHSSLYDNGYIWQAEFEQGTDIIECCGIYFGK